MSNHASVPKARQPATNDSPWTPAAEREQQREAKRNAVLSTAARLFNERGFHATSLDDIAAELHVTKPTLYYYVKNKDDILLQCVRKGLEMILEGIEQSRSAGGKAVDQLVASMHVYARIVTMDFGMCLIRVGDEQLPPDSRKELRRLKSLIDQQFRRLVAEGVEEGSLAPCDPRMAAFVIGGALSWIGRWYQPGGEYVPDQVADQCIATLCGGLLRRPGATAQSAPAAAKGGAKAAARKRTAS
ncbi:transcriptional regulator, TetR family [Burkholderia sp. lig30]|jgi:AcrR family transcriptional regulator|uniref:TetR/AcrR family transcriptional regulator n=1 Tax=Burkholderia sp. lig30 TaxID=1192124 RepID=UPI0004617439|nr:TetR/AcrR family transcriptional regulator [Burkholderia sp. lig30]KDB06401.1 transcriptional regulator, TetR family [Burkholderia sp. lig30]